MYYKEIPIDQINLLPRSKLLPLPERDVLYCKEGIGYNRLLICSGMIS